MSKQEYRVARQLIRDNGYYALRWMLPIISDIMLKLKNQPADILSCVAQYHAQRIR